MPDLLAVLPLDEAMVYGGELEHCPGLAIQYSFVCAAERSVELLSRMTQC
jgi:hypothetical protein